MNVFCDRLKPYNAGLAKTKADIAKKSSHSYSSCYPAMFCLITSSKLFRQYFELSPKVKVMRSNPDYLLKYFLLNYARKSHA